MRLYISKFILLAFIGIIIGQNQSPYLDIANELLVRKKLAKKLPDVFDNAKYSEVVDKIDAFAQISEWQLIIQSSIGVFHRPICWLICPQKL